MRKFVAVLAAALLALPFLVASAHADVPYKAAQVFNTAASANTDIVSADFTPAGARAGTAAYRVSIALVTTDSIVELQVISGATTVEADLNSGTALTAGKIYTFTFGASSSLLYNIQCETATTIGYLLIEEIRDGAL